MALLAASIVLGLSTAVLAQNDSKLPAGENEGRRAIEPRPAGGTAAAPAIERSTDPAADLSNVNLTKKYPELSPAWEKLEKNDRAGAVEILKAAVAKTPTLPPVELLVARFYLEQGNGTQAIHELDQAAQKHPQDPGAFLSLAGIALLQGRHTDGALLLERTEKLLAAMPDSHPRKKALTIVTNNQWATVHGRFERWEQARDRLREVLKLDPENAMVHYRLATALFGLKKGQEGYTEFQAAYKINNKLPTPPIAVVIYYQRTNQPEAATKWMEFSEKEFGKDGPTRLFLGTAAWQRGQIDDTKRHIAAAAAASPDSPEIQLLQGVLAHYDGDLKTAEDKLETAFKAAPKNLQVRDQLAKVLIQSADQASRERALALAQQSAQMAQNDRDAIATFGWVLYNAGKTDAAMQAMGAVTQGPLSGDTAYFVARILVDQKRNDDARKLLENALQGKTLFVHRPSAEKLLKQIKS